MIISYRVIVRYYKPYVKKINLLNIMLDLNLLNSYNIYAMAIAKKYLHDKSILLLLTSNLVLAFISITLIILRLNNGRTGIYIVQRRANLGIDQYTQGGTATIISFIVFSILVVLIGFFLSFKAFKSQRNVSIAVLGLCLLLLICTLIVSNSLLAMH